LPAAILRNQDATSQEFKPDRLYVTQIGHHSQIQAVWQSERYVISISVDGEFSIRIDIGLDAEVGSLERLFEPLAAFGTRRDRDDLRTERRFPE